MTKTCASCGAPLAEGAKFCMKCGAPVPVEASSPSFCPNCGEKVQAGVRFCPNCGQLIEESMSVDNKNLSKPQTGFFGFKGRMNRMPYAIRSFVLIIAGLIALSLVNYLPFAALIISLFVLVSGMSMNIRRLHDLNQNDLFVLLAFAPIVNIGLFIYLLFAEGTSGINKYGLDPLGKKEDIEYTCPRCGHRMNSINEDCPKCEWNKDKPTILPPLLGREKLYK